MPSWNRKDERQYEHIKEANWNVAPQKTEPRRLPPGQ